MPSEPLSQISTQWSQIEMLTEKEGLAALADYLSARYFEPLAKIFKKYRSKLDDLTAHGLASDVFYDLIKNDYKALNRLDRDRGKLRGLFFTIVRAKLSGLGKNYQSIEEFEEQNGNETANWIEICLDLNTALEKLQKESPLLHKTFIYHYLEDKKILEIAKILRITEDAVKQRLCRARQWLAKALEGYQVL
jgi:RNA polymerase sigma factor (sigma-70 family)